MTVADRLTRHRRSLQVLRQAGRQSQTDRMILLLQPTRIDAPKRGKLNHIGFTRKVTAAVLPNSRQRFTSGEPACDKRILLACCSSAILKDFV